MLRRFFHDWERRLADVSKDRVVRPFEWGLDWLDGPEPPGAAAPLDRMRAWTEAVMRDTPAFFHAPPTTDYDLDGDMLRFPSAFVTPHPENNIVVARCGPPFG